MSRAIASMAVSIRLSDRAYLLGFLIRGKNLDSVGTYDLQIGFSCLGSPQLHNEHFVQSVDLSASSPTPVYLERKTNLYVIERAHCSRGVAVANFVGSLADSEEGMEVRMLIANLHSHQHSNLRDCKKVNKNAPFQILKRSNNVKEVEMRTNVLVRKKHLIPCFSNG